MAGVASFTSYEPTGGIPLSETCLLKAKLFTSGYPYPQIVLTWRTSSPIGVQNFVRVTIEMA